MLHGPVEGEHHGAAGLGVDAVRRDLPALAVAPEDILVRGPPQLAIEGALQPGLADAVVADQPEQH
ncbi:MAG: hypothetical protein ACK56I_24700, partial [bacterium]